MVIGKVFDLAHLVADLDATDRLLRPGLRVRARLRRHEQAAHRPASPVVVGDQCFEPIKPSDQAEANDTTASLQGPLRDRFHSIAWYIDDLGRSSPTSSPTTSASSTSPGGR